MDLTVGSDRAAGLGIEIGQTFGPSDWIAIPQPMISAFGDVSLDPDPMHIDPAWATANSPYGGTIAFGFLTVALLTALLHSAMGTGVHTDPSTTGVYLNYGFDRLRLVEPVPVDSRVRGTFVIDALETDAKQRCVVTFLCTVEIEGVDRPALVAKWLTIWVPPQP
jgi:acyl dehydratase